MIAVDTNLLVFAHRRDHEFHAPAARCISNLASRKAGWAIPWPCVHEFFSVVTHPRIFKQPSPPQQAMAQIEAWLESPSLTLLSETRPYWSTLREQLEQGNIQGPMVHDARIAALCLLHGVTTLYTQDRDFSRFPDLRVKNPLTLRV